MKISIVMFCTAAVATGLVAQTADRGASGNSADNRPITIEFAADHRLLAPGGELARTLPAFDTTVPLGIDRPEAITAEPTYRGTPLYGIIRLGNASNGRFHVVVDHPKAGQWEQCRVFVDANRNGDFTDDAAGEWGQREGPRDGTPRLGPKQVTLRASYSTGRDDIEVRHGQYSLLLTYSRRAPDAPMELSIRRATAQVGELKLGDATHQIVFVENDNDAMYLFNKGESGRPMWLLVDENNDGKFSESERHDARGGLVLRGRAFAIRPASDGSKMQLSPFTGPMPQRIVGQAPRQPRLELLATGANAPDFEALTPDNAKIRLSDYRGKIVVLDFWATWCGPCIASMPSLEELHRATADQGVAVIGLCVFDTREKFDGWMQQPRVKTTYLKAFDPAGRNNETENADSIAKKLYHVTAIPTFYVIDREGKVAASFLGSGEASRRGLRETLTKLGVKL